MNAASVAPLEDRVIVRQDDEPQKSQGGIFLPETAKEAPQFGTVVRVGPGKILESGSNRPMNVKEGDKVIFGKYSGTKIKIDDQELLFMREEDIMGVVES